MGTIKETHSAEFMFKEYERINGLWIDENHQAEQRVNFFITILTASTGAIILISQSSTLSNETVYTLAIGVLIILLSFGISILNRLSARNVQVRALHQSLVEIQDYFADKDPEINKYLNRQRNVYRGRKYRFNFASTLLGGLAGGLTAMVILANGFICGGITLLLFSRSGYPIQHVALWAGATTLLAIPLLYLYNFLLKRILPLWKYY